MSTSPKSSRPVGPQAFDIFHPSRVRPQSTSRPVIVSNKPEQADPMVLKQPEAIVSEPTTAPAVPSHSKNPELATNAPKVEAAVTTPVSTSDTPVGPPEVAHAAAVSEPHTPSEKTATTGNAESVTEPTPPGEQPETPAPIDHLEGVDDRDKLLPWNEVTSAATEKPIISIHAHRRGAWILSWTLTFLGIIAVLAAGADIALDAGWISVSGVPHTHFIKR